MACMKCGKEIKGEQVFCPSCLAVMESYPVRPDVHIQLPNRPTAAASRKKRRRSYAPDDQLVHLRRYARQVTALAVVLGLLLVAAGSALVYLLMDKDDSGSNFGTNYTYNETSE